MNNNKPCMSLFFKRVTLAINVTRRFRSREGALEEKFVVPNENEQLNRFTRPFKASQSVPLVVNH